MEQTIYLTLALVAVAAVITLCFVFILFRKVSRLQIGNKRVEEIQDHIHSGAMTFLTREYKLIIPFVLGIAALLAVLGFIPALQGAEGIGWKAAICFVIGALFSAAAGWIGMSIATKANARTAMKAKEEGMSGALKVAFSGGSVLGLSVAGFGLIGLVGIFLVVYLITKDIHAPVQILTGYSLGCSLIALFARVGGGIYTKAADVGADLVGKLEAGIPEDDPRNPATIADNVGDNVGDIAGMGSDLTESYVGSIISCLTMALFTGLSYKHILFPILICGVGILASLISVIIVRARNWKDPHKALNFSTYIATALVVVASVLLAIFYLGEYKYMFSVIVGLAAGIAIGFVAELYTSDEFSSVKTIAKESQTGHGTNIIAGLGVGMRSTWLTIACLSVAIALAYFFGGAYGISLAAVGMLCTVGITVSVDGYGPIADNAGGIAEMAGLPKEVRQITDKLDAVGNTTAAIGKGFCIGSAALTSLAFIVSFVESVKTHVPGFNISLSDPCVLVGLLIGAMLPYLFSAMTIGSVGKAANKMVEEVRAQFEKNPDILTGKSIPDYNRCIDISTKASLREMIAPGLLAILAPAVVGVIFGAAGLGGMLMGGLVSAIMLAVFMANAGGAWDNAKKHVEAGNFGGKGSETHKASITGDTVGDPLKDTAGPAMDILIKLISVISLILVPVLVKITPLWDIIVAFFEKI
ncbi:MAG: sodium-translocating pyrophosphatase [Clostridia bacterium]|nr:sodium-translocating pyrophosphatase [Clostridia bacterium]MBQ1965795.1 sodium-translocating pyrophosphatase [Clostridia bacterium]MBQ5742752.1 sodium-translocating pyrophosphatase [Clostridia bacterium]